MSSPSYQGPLEALVAHRGSMLWVQRLLHDDAHSVRVEATVRRGDLFVGEHGLPAWAGLELMAQAVAVWVGLRRVQSAGPVRAGLLLGTRRFACTQPAFPVGARLEIEARREVLADNGLAVFACCIVWEGANVATASVNAFEPPEPRDG